MTRKCKVSFKRTSVPVLKYHTIAAVHQVQDPDKTTTVVTMEDSGGDSETFQKFKRLAETKKSELAYKYNPDVDSNKKKNMVPLWENAKKTVEGGLEELNTIIEDQKKSGAKVQETLKLEVVSKDLELIKMKFEMLLHSKGQAPAKLPDSLTQDQMMELLERFSESKLSEAEQIENMRQQHHLDLASITTLLDSSQKARDKIASFFFCRGKCSQCNDCSHRNSTETPCIFKGENEFCFEGVMVKFAFITCVRSLDPKLREQAMTSFRRLVSIDDNVGGSDIRKLIDISPRELMTFLLDEVDNLDLVTLLCKLVHSAAQAVWKITCGSQYETLGKSTIMYKIETDLKKEHTYIYGTLYEQEGMFGFVNWLSKILLLSLSEEDVKFIPADMFIFNLEICAPLVKIFKYGTDSYPWVEAMIYNFSKTFKRIWTTPNSKEWHRTEDFIAPVKSKQNKKDLILTQSVIPRFNKAEVCGQCHKRIAKTPKLFPMCFQGSDIQCFPREIAKMERPESEYDKPVTMDHMLNSRRSTVLVCSASCMLHAMSQMNRELYQICVFIPMHLGREGLVKECFDTMGLSDEDYQDYLTFSQEEKNNMMTRGIRQMTREIKKEIRYNNLRWIVESVYPQGQIRVVNGKLEVDNKAKMKKETLLTVKSVEAVQSNPFEDCEINFAAKAKRDIPSNITDYISHLLLHSNKETSCDHSLVWGGWAKYHPVNKMEKYIEQRDEDGFSKTCIDFQLKMETCDQIDLKLMGEKNRLELQKDIEELKKATLHLFPLVLLENYAVGLRDKCYKLALSGPSNLDDVAMDKVFSSSNAVLGLWGDPHFKTDGTIREFFRRDYKGVIICRSPKTYFAFLPHPHTSILNVLSHVTQMPVNKDLLIELTFARKLNIIHSLTCLNKSKEFNELPEELRDNIMFMTFSLGTMDAIGRREEFERLVKGNGLCEIRFNALHLHKHHSCLNNVLYKSPATDLVRYSPKHLIGCPHELMWTGNLIFSDNVYRHKVSGWAYLCRCLSEKLMLKQTRQSPVMSDREAENLRVEYEKTKAELSDKQETIQQLGSSIPNMIDQFQKCIENRISQNTNNKQKTLEVDKFDTDQAMTHEFMKDFQNQNIEVLVFPCGGDYDFADSVHSPNLILFDLGSVPKRLVDQIKNPKNLVASALSTYVGNRPMIKHFLRFCHIDGQIYGKLIPKEHHELYAGNFNRGMMMYDPMEFDGKTMVRQESETFCMNMETRHRNMNIINKNAELLSAKCLWVGEMQCLSIGDQVLGFQMDQQLTDVARTDERHAIMASNDEDIGAIRNGPILATTGHYVYSNYVAITPTKKSDISQTNEAFFNKARETGVSLVAINVDRRVIENIIGTFKKCSAVQVHAQDGFYLQTELRDTKKTFLAFFLEKDEHVLDVLKISASEAAKRFWILKHDNKDDKLALYTPKETGKMEQIWKNFCKTPLMTSHEKMLKKLRKHDKQEGVQIKTVLTKNPDPNEADIISVVAEPIAKNGAVKKSEKQTPVEEKSSSKTNSGTTTLSNVNQNLKKMFLPDSEKEKTKIGNATGGEKVEKVKICWNCHATGAENGGKLLKCEGCRKARYCDYECQQEDWDRHGAFCVKMRERRKEKRRVREESEEHFKIFRPDEMPPEILEMINPEDQLEAFHKWRLEMEK